MKKISVVLLILILLLSLCACGGAEGNANSLDTTDTAENSVPAPTNENTETISATQTPITLTIGDTVIPAVLNDTKAAQDLISRLPYTVSVSRSSVDYCGTVSESFEYDENELRSGWDDGDITFIPGNWFSIFFDGANEDATGFATMGHIDEQYLDVIARLGSSIDVTVALSEGASNTAPSDSGDLDENGMINVNITVGDKVFGAKFHDNESSQAIISEMPFTLEMDDYASQEKVTDLAFALPSASTETPATINSGDIYLWSGNSLVLFYTTFSNSYSYVPVGYVVDNAGWRDALGRGSVTVTFQIAE